MNTTWASLRTAIASKLATITQLKGYTNYHAEGGFSGFPFVTFEPSSSDNTMFTNTDNLRGYSWDLYVFQEIENCGRAAAVGYLINAVDAIIAAFDSDPTLSGACHYCIPVPTYFSEIVIGSATMKYAKLTLVCHAEITVT
jgi:hypothetical protein